MDLGELYSLAAPSKCVTEFTVQIHSMKVLIKEARF